MPSLIAELKELLLKAGFNAIVTGLRNIAKGINLGSLLRKKAAISPITPEQIYDAASYIPALKRADIFSQYLGLRVNWFTTLISAQREPGDDRYVRLKLRAVGDLSAKETSVFCAVRFSHYPELTHLGEHSPIRVIGRIDKIEEAGITLRDVELIRGQWTTP
jgi:hypothetical protein